LPLQVQRCPQLLLPPQNNLVRDSATEIDFRFSVLQTAVGYRTFTVHQALMEYLHCLENGTLYVVSGTRTNHCVLPFDCIQIWYKVRMQQMQYYNSKVPDGPQTLRALPPSTSCPHSLYDAVVINTELQSEWPRCGLNGMSSTM